MRKTGHIIDSLNPLLVSTLYCYSIYLFLNGSFLQGAGNAVAMALNLYVGYILKGIQTKDEARTLFRNYMMGRDWR